MDSLNPAPSIPSPWPGPRLLVPINVNVMLQSPISATQPWSASPINYVAINGFADPGPAPFNQAPRLVPGTTTGQVLSGASISWALPSALTRADKDTAAFPPVPNRWLVVRRCLIGGSATYVAWVIESDYQSTDQAAATNQYPTGLAPNPDPTVDNPDQLALSYFGRAVPLGQWPRADSPISALQPPLTAIGPGDPSFAAFQPGTPNVMAFNDLLADVPAATLTYWVAGWYAQPALDPLYCFAGGGPDGNGSGWTTKAEWLDLMRQFGWSVGSDADLAAAVAAAQAWSEKKRLSVPGTGDQQLYPAQILCHGLSYNADWVGQDISQPTGIPYDPTITIGVGRTTIEAFGAMVAAQINATAPGTGDEVARTIQALQYHLLDTEFDTTGAPSLDEAIHDGAFGSRKGGTIWTLAPAQGSGSAPLAGNLVQALVALNGAQAAADEAARQLAAGQQELYTAWYRAVAADMEFAPTQESLDYLTKLQTQVVPALLSSAQTLATARDSAEGTLRALIAPITPPPTLKETPAPPFWSPLDPVLSISGLGRAFAFGEDTGPSPDDTLFCRFSGQTLTGIHAGSAQGTLVTGASLLNDFPANAKVPYDIGDIAAECLLLDTAVAPEIAQAAGGVDANYVQKQQTIVWNGASQFDQQSIAEAAGLVGTVPCVIASVAWTNAWVPLYLDWEVSWTQFDPSQWSFNGEDFTPANPSPATPVTLSGRAVLTPNAGNDLYRTILRYAENNPSDAKAQALKNEIAGLPDADVLSQRLSGFGSLLRMLQINTASFPPSAAAIPSALLQATAGTIPYASAIWFYPVPAGQFSVTKLWVIDAFGQILPVIDDPAPTSVVSTYYAPPIQASAQTATTIGQLPPRVIQPTRVEFDLIDAADGTSIVAQDPAANPVCGWLLPNHLDLGVSVYDQNGAAIGEVVTAGTTPNQYLLWRPTPGNPQGLGEPPAIANPLLADIINSYLLNSPEGVANLQRLLNVIDETLSSFRPPIAGSVTSMAAAIGNPVAVVSAKVTVRLSGAPALSQFTLGPDVTNSIGDAATFAVPFQLGSLVLPEDGLLGYFVNGDFNDLLSLAPSGARSVGVLPANAVQFTLPLVSQGPASAPLVLLMDPRGSVHVSTGCLPVLEVKVPQRDVAAALANMLVTFQAGPVLTDLPNIRIPVPSLGKGTWTWLDRPTPSTLAAPASLTAADAKPRLPTTPLSVVEGWLQLSGALDQ